MTDTRRWSAPIVRISILLGVGACLALPAAAQRTVVIVPEVARGQSLLSAGGDVIVAEAPGGVDFRRLQVSTGQWRHIPRVALTGETAGATVQLIALSGDGRFLAYESWRNAEGPRTSVLSRFDIDAGTRVVVRDSTWDPFSRPAMSRDGRSMVWIGTNNAVLVGTVGQTPVAVGSACPPSSASCPAGPVISADGQRVAYLRDVDGTGATAGLETFDRVSAIRDWHPAFRPVLGTTLAATATLRHVATRHQAGTSVYDLDRRLVDNTASLPSHALSDDARYLSTTRGLYDRHSTLALSVGETDGVVGTSADARHVLARFSTDLFLLDLDGEADGMLDPWETMHGFDPGSAADASLDFDGDGVSNRAEFERGSHPRGRYRRYFAEGVSSDSFETTLYLLADPSVTYGHDIVVSFLGANGDVATQRVRFNDRTAGGAWRFASRATRPATLWSSEYAIVAESDEPFVAERVTTWGGLSPRGSHASAGSERADGLWVFAEGTTRNGMQTFLLLANPSERPATVRASYHCSDPTPAGREYVVPAGRRMTVWLNQEGSPVGDNECGVILTSTEPVVAERSMYLAGAGGFEAGTSAVGLHTSVIPPNLWYFAEGSASGPFDMFLALTNPDPAASHAVDVTYLLPGGHAIQRRHVAQSLRRTTIWVDYEDPRLADAHLVGVRVEAPTGPVFVERAIWWRGSDGGWVDGHAEHGTQEPRTRWGIAHLPESGSIAILNPSSRPADVRIVLFADEGIGGAEATITVPPGPTRLRPIELWPALGPARYAATVENRPSGGLDAVHIVVERTSFIPGTPAGSSSLATPLP